MEKCRPVVSRVFNEFFSAFSYLEMQLRDRDLVRLSKSAVNKPAYFIVVYHAKKYVVIGIRGTYNTTDILTDLCPHNEPFQKG